MRICTQISTGKVLEMQSHGTAGTLIANAIAAGFPQADLAESIVTEAQYEALVPIVRTDASDIDLLGKQLKALAVLMRQYINQTRAGATNTVTLAALKTDFKTVFDALP